MIDYRNVLFCTDFSDNAQKALPQAIDLARKYGAMLHVLHVYYDSGHLAEFEKPSDDKTEGAPTIYIKGAELERRLDEIRAEVTAAGQQCTCRIVRGIRPFTEIVRYAKEEAIDLIVLSSHGLTNLEHALFGGTTEKVVRHSPCDIIVVKTAARR